MPQLGFTCPENIESMQKTETGTYCKTCSERVIDFTTYTAQEIQAYFIQHRGEKICGTFRKNQLHQPEQSILSSLFRYAFALVFLLGLNSTDLFSQEQRDSTLNRSAVQDSSIIFSGTITNEAGEPVHFAKVTLYADSVFIVGAISSELGQYKLIVPKTQLTGKVELKINFIGYDSRVYVFQSIDQLTYHLDIVLTENTDGFTTGIIVQDPYIIDKDPGNSGRIRIKGDDLRHRQR